MFYSHLVIQQGRGQAQGWPRLAPGSLSSKMWDLALGEMLLVTGIPPGCPRCSEPAARELPLPTQNAPVHVLYIPDVISRATATARSHPGDVNAAAQICWSSPAPL